MYCFVFFSKIIFYCITVTDFIILTVAENEDYWKMVRLLQKRKLNFHTYELPCEDIRVVILGKKMETKDIYEDLIAQGFKVHAVHAMHTQLPLFLVNLPRTENKIFDVSKICGISGINVEKQQPRSAPGQCYRCQKYGHSQANCHLAVKCVRCGGGHRAAECKLPKAAKCANCGGPHVANYRGSPTTPKMGKSATLTEVASARKVATATKAARRETII